MNLEKTIRAKLLDKTKAYLDDDGIYKIPYTPEVLYPIPIDDLVKMKNSKTPLSELRKYAITMSGFPNFETLVDLAEGLTEEDENELREYEFDINLWLIDNAEYLLDLEPYLMLDIPINLRTSSNIFALTASLSDCFDIFDMKRYNIGSVHMPDGPWPSVCAIGDVLEVWLDGERGHEYSVPLKIEKARAKLRETALQKVFDGAYKLWKRNPFEFYGPPDEVDINKVSSVDYLPLDSIPCEWPDKLMYEIPPRIISVLMEKDADSYERLQPGDIVVYESNGIVMSFFMRENRYEMLDVF